MSGLANLYAPPASDADFKIWSFVNQQAHRDINDGIFSRLGVTMPLYVLDPFDPKKPTSLSAFLDQHQDLHLQQNQLLGIASHDLTDVDWNNPYELAVWIANHAVEHWQAAQILGLN